MTVVGGARSASPCLAPDIGGTNVEAAIVSADGSPVRRDRFTISDDAPDLFDAIVTLSRRVLVADDVNVVGVGCAGPMTRGAS